MAEDFVVVGGLVLPWGTSCGRPGIWMDITERRLVFRHRFFGRFIGPWIVEHERIASVYPERGALGTAAASDRYRIRTRSVQRGQNPLHPIYCHRRHPNPYKFVITAHGKSTAAKWAYRRMQASVSTSIRLEPTPGPAVGTARQPVPERDATWPSGLAADGVIMRRRDEENVGQVGNSARR